MSAPRLVVLTRPTQLAELLAEHSTMGAVDFFLTSRGQSLERVVQADRDHERTVAAATALVPADWRLALVDRDGLSRFLFEPDDLVAVVGQDGLVANVAKYLTGQVVIGINPSGASVLCRSTVADLRSAVGGRPPAVEPRATVQATLDDGQTITALNEVFVGDVGHQSARYELTCAGATEAQSSSGLIVGTGTGATGWLSSLWRQSRPGFPLPGARSRELAWFVREAWPSVTTGASLTAGLLAADDALTLRARGPLVVFGDGIERDRLRVGWGQEIRITVSDRELRLAVPAGAAS